MALPNLQSLSDEDLEKHFQQVLAEQQKRQNLSLIPQQIADLRKRFVEYGGNPEDLPGAPSAPEQTT